MSVIVTQDKRRIETYLRKDMQLHLCEIGDLDPFFRPQTTWLGFEIIAQYNEWQARAARAPQTI